MSEPQISDPTDVQNKMQNEIQSEIPLVMQNDVQSAARDIAEVPAVEVITAAAVNLLSAAAIKCGLSDDPENETDLDEARKLINALAGLITAGAPEISDSHARPLRDGLRSVQLAFREASAFPDAPGKGPGEKYTGSVI